MVNIGRWLTAGWEAFKPNAGVFMVAGLLAGLLSLCTCMILEPVMVCGFAAMSLKALRGQKPEVGDVFLGFQRFGETIILVVIALVLGAIGSAGFFGTRFLPQEVASLGLVVGNLVQFVVSPIITLLIIFTAYQIMDSTVDVSTAFSRSIKVIQGNLVMFWIAALVLDFIVYIGIFACCFGILVTFPIVLIAYGAAYMDNFTGPVTPAATPPPPTPSV